MRFLGREITFNKDKDSARPDDNVGDVIRKMTNAAMPEVQAYHRQMQKAAAEQAKRLRDESRALAILMGEDPDAIQ